jgi:hypothetical protein
MDQSGDGLTGAFTALGAEAAAADDTAFAPEGQSTSAASAFASALGELNDLLRHVLERLDALASTPAGPNVAALDAKVVELGGALGSIATMLESIETAVHAEARPGPAPGAALVERVAAAGGTAGINALLHARIEAIEQHVEGSSAELRAIRAQLDHLEDGIGYLAAGLLGGG